METNIPEKSTKARPAYIPMKCPVCNGFTTVNYGKQTCAACKGKGWIPVPPEEQEEEEGYGYNK